MSHHIVRARSQKQLWLLRLVAVVAVILIVWGGFEYGRYRGGYDVLSAKEQSHEQKKQVQALNHEITQLREQKAILERSSEIEQEASKQLQGTVNGLQDEILELKEELAFYRGIVSPGDATKGLNLQSFELKPGRGERTYHYKMVLTQVLSTGSVAYGNIAFSVEGTEKGKEKEYTLAQLSDINKELRFRFKYFQSFEGDIALPQGFIPSKVNLVVKPRSRRHKQLTESVDWTVQES